MNKVLFAGITKYTWDKMLARCGMADVMETGRGLEYASNLASIVPINIHKN